jgi:hypothetical protein
MSTEQEAREAMSQQRQQEEHLHQSMLNRSQAQIKTPIDSSTQEEARKLLVEQRQQEEQTHQSMLSRSEAEVGIPTETPTTD